MKAYLRRTSTEKLEQFLRDYRQKKQKEDFANVVGEVIRELSRRKAEKSRDSAGAQSEKSVW